MNKLKLWSVWVSLFMVLTVLSACNMNNGAGQVTPNDSRQFGMNATRNGGESLGQFRNDRFQDNTMDRRMDFMRGDHNNTNLETSQEIAEQIAAMDGVNHAYVLLTDRNAYVAVVIDEDEDYGRNGQLGLDQGQQGRGRTRNPEGETPDARHGSNLQFGEYHTMQDGITQMMKNRIADKVKSLKPDTRNVYVSANPDFASRVQGYAGALDDGQPFEGLIEEFNTMVQRLFPQEAGENSARMQRDQMNRVQNPNQNINR